MDNANSEWTLSRPMHWEAPAIKGSRFIANLASADRVEEAEKYIAEIRQHFIDASHNCFAWRIGHDGQLVRASDDGEPAGSAGRPMLQILEGRRLINVVAVITRYYGGTKLGVGGLVRAYSGTLATAIEQADLERVIPMLPLCLRFAFKDENRVLTVLHKHDLSPDQVNYTSAVNMKIHVPADLQSELIQHLENALSGNIRIQDVDSR